MIEKQSFENKSFRGKNEGKLQNDLILRVFHKRYAKFM